MFSGDGETAQHGSSYAKESFNGMHSSYTGYSKHSMLEPDWLRFGYHPAQWPIAACLHVLVPPIRDCLTPVRCSQIPPPLSALSGLTRLKSGVCEAHSPAVHHHSSPFLFSEYKSHVYYPSAGPFAERTANMVQGE